MTRRASPKDMRRAAEWARQNLTCEDCGAAPCQPCDSPGRGKTVCTTRYRTAMVTLGREARAARRTPEQAAILAGLPHVPREEIEACRTPGGGYSFTKAWFLAHGLPYPPVAGWRQAVERENDRDDRKTAERTTS